MKKVLDKDKLSLSDKSILHAYQMGYRSNDEGEITSHKGNKISLSKGTNNYLLFGIRKNGKSTTVSAHRFSAYCYFGDDLFSSECVMHLNGIKTDNSKENLSLGSLKENYKDNCEIWKKEFSLKGARKRRKLTSDQVKEIKSHIKNKRNISQVARDYGVARSTIQQISEGKSYTWVK